MRAFHFTSDTINDMKLVPMSVIRDFTQPYSAVESWFYDRFLAPAVCDFALSTLDELLTLAGQGQHLLDVGCGGGQLIAELARRRDDLRLTGLDLSKEQIARAKRRCAEFGGRISLHQGSALDMPFADESFDGVFSVASIKHWPDPHRGLHEILRVLKPSGRFFVVEVDRGCKLDDARRFVARWRLPKALRVVALPFFRTYVAGQGLEADEARALLQATGAVEAELRRWPNLPILVLTGRRSAVTSVSALP